MVKRRRYCERCKKSFNTLEEKVDKDEMKLIQREFDKSWKSE